MNKHIYMVVAALLMPMLLMATEYTVVLKAQGCASVNNILVAGDTVLTIAATADPGYHFTSWSDGATDNAREVAITSDTIFTALFERDEPAVGPVTPVDPSDSTFVVHQELGYRVTLASTACSSVNTIYVLNDTTLFIAATPAQGARFARWSDGCVDNPRLVAVMSDTTFTAEFEQLADYYTIYLTSQECSTTDTLIVPTDSTIVIAAAPELGYDFVAWNDGVTDNPRSLQLTQNMMLMASFAPTFDPDHPVNPGQYKLMTTASPIEGGTITGAGNYAENAVVSLTATANKGYQFVGWSDGVNTATRSIIMVAHDTTLVANFQYMAQDTVVVDSEKKVSELPVGDNTNIVVSETGYLNVDETMNVKSLTIYVSGANAAQINGVENLSVEEVKMVLRLEPKKTAATLGKWYAFAVPFDVAIATGVRHEGASQVAVHGEDYVIDCYDGAQRALTQEGWVRCNQSSVLNPGKFYMIAVNGTQNTWEFTKKVNGSLTQSQQVVAQENEAASSQHSGWNGLSNTLWQAAKMTIADKGILFVTMYNNELGIYEVVPVKGTLLPTGCPFFVQVDETTLVDFTQNHAALSVASRQSEETAPAQYSVLTFSSQQESGYQALNYLAVSETKYDVYTIGRDVQRMSGSSLAAPQMWMNAYNVELSAYEALLNRDMAIVSLGLYAPVEGGYSLTTTTTTTTTTTRTVALLKDGKEVELDATGDANTTKWILYLTQGISYNYALQISGRGISTEVQNAECTRRGVEKVMTDGTLYIKRDGAIYRADGSCISK